MSNAIELARHIVDTQCADDRCLALLASCVLSQHERIEQLEKALGEALNMIGFELEDEDWRRITELRRLL